MTLPLLGLPHPELFLTVSQSIDTIPLDDIPTQTRWLMAEQGMYLTGNHFFFAIYVSCVVCEATCATMTNVTKTAIILSGLHQQAQIWYPVLEPPLSPPPPSPSQAL
jgi:hypothetical protein